MGKKERRKRRAEKEQRRLNRKNGVVWLGLFGRCPVKRREIDEQSLEFCKNRDRLMMEAMSESLFKQSEFASPEEREKAKKEDDDLRRAILRNLYD